MGRHTKLTDGQMAFVVEAYRKGDKTRGLAEDLGVSQRTIQRIILLNGKPRKRGRRPHEHFGKLAAYVASRPEETFPRSLSKIAERTGSSIGAVKAYLYRNRKALKEAASQIDFMASRFKYKDIKGRTIPARAIESCTATVESWTNVVRLNVVLKGGAGHTTIRLPAKLIALLSSKAKASPQ